MTFKYFDRALPKATQCHRGYQIGQDLCGCIQKSKGCVTSKKAASFDKDHSFSKKSMNITSLHAHILEASSAPENDAGAA